MLLRFIVFWYLEYFKTLQMLYKTFTKKQNWICSSYLYEPLLYIRVLCRQEILLLTLTIFITIDNSILMCGHYKIENIIFLAKFSLAEKDHRQKWTFYDFRIYVTYGYTLGHLLLPTQTTFWVIKKVLPLHSPLGWRELFGKLESGALRLTQR